MMMFAVLFGLSMDYEVFLLSRVREEYQRTRDNRRAVADGLASTARVITAAAAIMVTVFGAFVLEDAVFLKMAGIGPATAVFVDATVVRLVLVPATTELLGDRNWWLPRWLDRLLPRVEVEDEAAILIPEPPLTAPGPTASGSPCPCHRPADPPLPRRQEHPGAAPRRPAPGSRTPRSPRLPASNPGRVSNLTDGVRAWSRICWKSSRVSCRHGPRQ
jgi:MMPL family